MVQSNKKNYLWTFKKVSKLNTTNNLKKLNKLKNNNKPKEEKSFNNFNKESKPSKPDTNNPVKEKYKHSEKTKHLSIKYQNFNPILWLLNLYMMPNWKKKLFKLKSKWPLSSKKLKWWTISKEWKFKLSVKCKRQKSNNKKSTRD